MSMTRLSLAQNTLAQPHRVGRAPRRPALARATARVVDRRGRAIALPLGARSSSRDVAVRASRDASRERLPTAEASPSPADAVARVMAPSPPAWAPWLAKFSRVAALAVVAAAVSALVFPDTALAAAKKTAAAASASADASWFKNALEWVVHLDKHLVTLFSTYGALAYGILFAIIFCETGLVVTPFLPGDSLLFATGALGAAGVLSFKFTLALLFVAAVLGDTVNYSLGSWIGGRVIEKYPTVFKKSYIEKTKLFYEQYGGKTVVLARFFVIVRTFAPFVAGVAKMNYKKFLGYNLVGAAVWVMSFMFLGYFFGQIPAVQENFAMTIAGIILLSLVPVVIEVVQHARGGSGEASGDEGEGEDLAVPARS
jgi:membrane-associated protein